MVLRVPSVGAAADLQKITGATYVVRLYANEMAGLSEGDARNLTAGDFDEANFAGYEAAEIVPGDWTVTEGDPSSAEAFQVAFVSVGDQAAQHTIWGYYVTENGALRWWEPFVGPVLVEFDGDEIWVTLRRTHEDTVSAQAR